MYESRKIVIVNAFWVDGWMNDGSVCKKWHFVGFSRIKILKNNEQVYLSVCEKENIFYCRILASVISAASWNLTITCWRIKMKWQNRTCVANKMKYVCECASQSVITCQKVSYHMWKSIQNECFLYWLIFLRLSFFGSRWAAHGVLLLSY